MKIDNAFCNPRNFRTILLAALEAEDTQRAAAQIGVAEASAGTEEMFRLGLQQAINAVVPSMPVHDGMEQWRKSGVQGLIREVSISEVSAPVTKHAKQRGYIDLVAAQSSHSDNPFISAIELKVMPFPHWESAGHFLWQICVDHARLHFAEGFSEEQCGWVVLLIAGPWVTKYRPQRSPAMAITDLKQVYHDMMHRDFSASMAYGDLGKLGNRHTQGYSVASAHLLGFDRPFRRSDTFFNNERMLLVADIPKGFAIVAHRADWAERWG